MKRSRWIWVVLVLLPIWGCGGTSFEEISGASSDAPPVRRELSGVWGGYFPGSSFDRPENGLELHFDRPVQEGLLSRAGFIHRENRQAHRHDVEVRQSGDQVVLVFDPGSSDEGMFEGVFLDDLTIRGTYTNLARGESHQLDLVPESSVPDGLQPVSARSAAQQVLPQAGSGDFLTLTLSFNNSFPGAEVLNNSIYFGLGPWRSSDGNYGTWSSLDDDQDFWSGGINYNRGVSTVRTLVFYPDWLLLELYPPADDENGQADNELASLEVPWSSLIDFDASQLADSSYAVQGFRISQTGDYDVTMGEVTDLQLSYEATGERFDATGLAVLASSPGSRPVVLSGEVYEVPASTQRMLDSLNFVLPYQQ